MEIVVHPARARPGRTLALVGFVALAAWGLATLTAPAFGISVGTCAAGIGLLFGFTLRAWLLPTRWVFDDEGVLVRGAGRHQRYAWSRFRGWRRERGGYYLSPFTDPTRFDHFRGLYVFTDRLIVRSSADDPDSSLARILEERIGSGLERRKASPPR